MLKKWLCLWLMIWLPLWIGTANVVASEMQLQSALNQPTHLNNGQTNHHARHQQMMLPDNASHIVSASPQAHCHPQAVNHQTCKHCQLCASVVGFASTFAQPALDFKQARIQAFTWVSLSFNPPAHFRPPISA